MGHALDQSISHLLHRANQAATERFAKAIGDSDLTPRQVAVLGIVAANEGVSQTGIVAASGIDRSTMADIVRRLVKRRLLARAALKAGHAGLQRHAHRRGTPGADGDSADPGPCRGGNTGGAAGQAQGRVAGRAGRPHGNILTGITGWEVQSAASGAAIRSTKGCTCRASM